MSVPFARRLLLLLGLTLLYIAAGKLGLALAFGNKSVSPVWPPTGVALAMCLVVGRAAWPAVLAGAFVVNVTTTHHVPSSVTIAVGNTLEAVVGAWLIERFAAGREAFVRGPSLGQFFIHGCILAPAISATVGALSLGMFGLALWDQAPTIWATWWLGDAVGALILTPALVGWAASPDALLAHLQRPSFVVANVLLVLTGLIVFAPPSGLDLPGAPLAFVCLPALVAIAYAFEPRVAATSALLLSSIAIYGTVSGMGPFRLPSANASLFVLQAFMGTCTSVALVLSSVVAERRQAEALLRASNEELERKVLERTATLALVNAELSEEVRERRAAQAALGEHARELARSNADLERFAYVASHDLQEPLRMVSSFVQLLKRRYAGQLDGDADRYIAFAVDGSERMRAMILGLLEFARAGRAPAEPADVDVGALARSVLADHVVAIRESGAEVTLGDLPVVRADPLGLRQVFSNLIGNAIKFRSAGPPHVAVTARRIDGDTWQFTVADDGIGIDAAHIDRLFSAFVRLHGPTEYPGAGIGLAVCKRIVEAHRGTIHVTSRKGEGSEFVFTIVASQVSG